MCGNRIPKADCLLNVLVTPVIISFIYSLVLYTTPYRHIMSSVWLAWEIETLQNNGIQAGANYEHENKKNSSKFLQITVAHISCHAARHPAGLLHGLTGYSTGTQQRMPWSPKVRQSVKQSPERQSDMGLTKWTRLKHETAPTIGLALLVMYYRPTRQ